MEGEVVMWGLGTGDFFCRATVISLFPAYQEGLLCGDRSWYLFLVYQ